MPTNDYSKNIVYLSKEQYQELITNETLTVNGQTITYNDNDIYVTPQAEPITDVKINGTSIGSNGVANIPLGTSTTPGVVMGVGNGIQITNGYVQVSPAVSSMIQLGSSNAGPVCVSRQHEAVFFGLSKVAGVDLASVTCTLGIYPDASKAAIQSMLGIIDLIASSEASTATAAHAANSLFMMDGKLMRATSAIAAADAVEVGTNCEVVKADEVFVKNTDYATADNAGIIKVNSNSARGLAMNSGFLCISNASTANIKAGTDAYKPITPNHTNDAVYYGLSKLAGVDLANETVTVGAYPNASKVAICKMIDALGISNISTGLSVTQDADTEDWILTANVQDVQINGTSIVNGGIADIPLAENDGDYGLVKFQNGSGGIEKAPSGNLRIASAASSVIKTGTESYRPIVPGKQHESVFYGLAKLAGADMAASSNAVGTYTDTAKSAIRNMLGAASPNVIAVQDEQPTDSDTKVWLPETEAQGIQVPTMDDMNTALAGKVSDVQVNGTSIISNGVADVPIASQSRLGVIRQHPTNTGSTGIQILTSSGNEGIIATARATDERIKAGTNMNMPIVPSNQHNAAFYGLAKAAGDTTQSISTNAVGTYTDDAKTAIQTMLGVPGDVQVNGTSVVSNGVANIPVAGSNYGVAMISQNLGVNISNGYLCTSIPDTAMIKAGTNTYKPIVSSLLSPSVFYGLAKAAGDTTMASSSNAVGTYTTEAKAAIHTMLGIDPASIAAQVDIPLVETVSGTTPTITGQPNVRYVCGEVSTITITPPASGSVDVIFESGSTATTMTVPSTVKWPAWFDAEALEANTTYEVLITDGIYGSVMTWAT